MVKDPVCGMGVDEDSAESFSMKYHETRYFFCSVDCLLLFSRTPHTYVNPPLDQLSLAKDVVCGMEVDMNDAPFTTEYNRKMYYFCSESCRQEFLCGPDQFVEKP